MFIGVWVPDQRKVAHAHRGLPLAGIETLLASDWDLVDSSAPQILGAWLLAKYRAVHRGDPRRRRGDLGQGFRPRRGAK